MEETGDAASPAAPPAAAGGHAEPFAAFYDRLAGRLIGAARTLGCSTAEAEDIVHDLFVRLARSGALSGDVADPEAYAFASLRHAVWRSRQRRTLEREAIERIGRGQGRGEDRPADAHPDVDLVRAAIGHLPEAQREVVALKIDGGLTFAQIAAVLGTNINTIAGRYRYALQALHKKLVHLKEDLLGETTPPPINVLPFSSPQEALS